MAGSGLRSLLIVCIGYDVVAASSYTINMYTYLQTIRRDTHQTSSSGRLLHASRPHSLTLLHTTYIQFYRTPKCIARNRMRRSISIYALYTMSTKQQHPHRNIVQTSESRATDNTASVYDRLTTGNMGNAGEMPKSLKQKRSTPPTFNIYTTL